MSFGYTTNRNNAPPQARIQLLEVMIFLLLLVPSIVPVRGAMIAENVSFAALATSVMMRDLALLGLVLYLVWKNGEGFRRIGWNFKRRGADVIWGLVLFVPVTIGAGLLEQALRGVGLSVPRHPPAGLTPSHNVATLVLASVLVIIVAVSEETIFRGYLLLRFRAITKSTVAAVLLSGVIFALGHGYEGSAGIVTIGVIGIIFALIYLWRQSLVAPMVMHFLQDFISIVVAAAIGGR